VFRADAPVGAEMPSGPQFELWQPVFAERRPVISDIFPGPNGGAQIVAVGVPVIRDGKVTHVLIAELDLNWYDRLMARQGLPVGAVAGLFDRSFNFVARSTEGPARRGQDPSSALVADMKRKPEGLGRYTNLNGTAVYTAWTFTHHGWGVAFATPSAPVDNAFWHHLTLFGFLWAAAVAAGMLYAFWKARPIAAALEALEGQAQHLATGERIASLPDSRVAEVNRLVAALEQASDVLQAATRERDRSLDIEREARAQAEAASHAKDEFLAMLSHELRNPLAAISMAAAVLDTGAQTGESSARLVASIRRQAQHLARLIDDLLEIGRMTANKLILRKERLELGEGGPTLR